MRAVAKLNARHAAYDCRVAYALWDEVAEAVQGEERLMSMLLPRVETSLSHPYFDQQSAIVSRRLDRALTKAGYVAPASGIADPLFKHAAIGMLVGLLTEASSSREQWEIDLYNAAVAYEKQLLAGDIDVVGAELSNATSDDALILGSGNNDAAIFDTDQPNAVALAVFAPLGPGLRGSWRR